MVEIKKYTVPEITNALDGFIIRPEMAKDRISKLEEMSIETFKIEIQREKTTEKDRSEYPRTVRQLPRYNISVTGNTRRRKKGKE